MNAALDAEVGRIAGAVYADLSLLFPHPPLLLVPGITLKVRRLLESVTSLRRMNAEQKDQLAEDLEVAIVPLLFALEIDPGQIPRMAPTIRVAARKAMEVQ